MGEKIRYRNSSGEGWPRQVWENILLARHLPQNANSMNVKEEEAREKEMEDERTVTERKISYTEVFVSTVVSCS